jgi:hypothetical protein
VDIPGKRNVRLLAWARKAIQDDPAALRTCLAAAGVLSAVANPIPTDTPVSDAIKLNHIAH